MPPPPRPNKDDRDDRAGVDEINDSLYGSGINLKDEENYLHNTYLNRHSSGLANDSFTSNQSTSFGGNTSSTTASPNNSCNNLLLTQGTSFSGGSGSQQDGAFGGTFNSQPLTEAQVEEESQRRRAQAAHQRAAQRQHHLSSPFLQGAPLYHRLHQRARESGVQVKTQGLQQSLPPQPAGNGDSEGVMTKVLAGQGQGQVGGEAVGLVRTMYRVESGTEYETLASLISLAAGERVRGLVEEAVGMARARCASDTLPPEYADLAQQDGELTDSKERSVTSTLLTLAHRAHAAERARLRAREARRTNNLDDPASQTPTEDAAAPTTMKLTKKEVEKAKKEAAKTAEASSHSTTNQTAAMMALGRKGAKYKWMSGGGAAGGAGGAGGGGGLVNRYAPQPPSASTSTPASATGATPAAAAAGEGQATALVKDGQAGDVVKWGEWREEQEPGVRGRDWAAVLERDGRAEKALQRLWLRMG